MMLLKLPKRLHHFRFGKAHGPIRWDLCMFQSLLEGHKASLKSVEIGHLESSKTSMTFVDFPLLETLNLSRWVFDLTPEMACSQFLAPNLHTFIWDFTIDDRPSENWKDFGPAQRDWLLKFAELAIAKKSSLRKIKIIFVPDEDSGPDTKEELESLICPWDLMDEVREALMPNGIELSYNECLTKQEYLEWIECIEEERKQIAADANSDTYHVPQGDCGYNLIPYTTWIR